MKQAFHFKGGNYTISSININTTEIKKIESLLSSKISQSQSFFHNTPFAIDIREVEDGANIDFVISIIEIFKTSGMIPIGVVTDNKDLKSQIAKTGNNILKIPSSKASNEELETEHQNGVKIITSPVRTGQTVESKDGDIIITANINNGAEVIADGNVIVYGRVGGRVIAGSSGDTSAKIICRDLKAELVAIAGKYVSLNNESILAGEQYKEGYVVYLQDDKIHIEGF